MIKISEVLDKSTELPNMVNMVNRQSATSDSKCYRSIRREHWKWKGTDYERRHAKILKTIFYDVNVNLNIHNA